MRIQLNRPLIVFDLETTGLDVAKDRIIQIAYVKLYPDGKEERYDQKVNPGRPIPKEVITITGISDDDVAACPSFKEIAPTLRDNMSDCDFAGFNSNHFDIPILVEEFLRAEIDFDFNKCQFIDIQTIYHKMEPRNLSAAYRFYCGREMEADFEPHRADNDAEATYRVLLGELEKYADGDKKFPGNDVKSLRSQLLWLDYGKGFHAQHQECTYPHPYAQYDGQNAITMLKGKKIVLGITGSIAAYKACLIIRLLVKSGAEVQVVITPAGKEFITPITLSALTHKPVVSEFFSQRDGTWHSHVDLGLWADAMLIAPCTASTLGKMAHGVADNMLVTTYLSMKAPVFIAPAMDLDMYAHPSTQQNIKILSGYGCHFIEPGSGFLASGLEGKGRMEEPERIVEELDKFFTGQSAINDLQGKRILITAGPTHEKIDPVRFIGNYSSGKMGFALAEECFRRGAEVTLIAGPVNMSCSSGIHRIDVESCMEMCDAAVKAFPQQDAAILCAAVADFKPSEQSATKIKREKGDLLIRLQPNPDIAATLGSQKASHQVLVGFALETNDETANAQKKLEKKNLDFIVLNSLRNEGTCFKSDDNQISIITRSEKKDFSKKPKQAVAKDIINELSQLI